MDKDFIEKAKKYPAFKFKKKKSPDEALELFML